MACRLEHTWRWLVQHKPKVDETIMGIASSHLSPLSKASLSSLVSVAQNHSTTEYLSRVTQVRLAAVAAIFEQNARRKLERDAVSDAGITPMHLHEEDLFDETPMPVKVREKKPLDEQAALTSFIDAANAAASCGPAQNILLLPIKGEADYRTVQGHQKLVQFQSDWGMLLKIVTNTGEKQVAITSSAVHKLSVADRYPII